MKSVVIVAGLGMLVAVAGSVDPAPPLPKPDTAWPQVAFASLDSFQVRYSRFYRSQFGTVAVAGLPTWLEVDVDSLSFGESRMTRMVEVRNNEEAILFGLRRLVSRKDETGMTQFSAEPAFPMERFVLGHWDGSLTLVAYDAWGVQDTLQRLDIVHHLKEQKAFLTDENVSNDIVILTRGNLMEVELWYPTLAREVLHTHTIPGNINPTGYLEFFEGSDRDMIMVSKRFQDPVRKYLLDPK